MAITKPNREELQGAKNVDKGRIVYYRQDAMHQNMKHIHLKIIALALRKLATTKKMRTETFGKNHDFENCQ
jgi:hypothetical protein